ncbi:MAG TPA: KH domain-containing protein, partial [Nevskiaceae bacterium]|nr:KH domain-containing protein [Nevskiaceae bacterium]
MGHKVNPNGFRLGITSQWSSNWYAERGIYTDNLNKDIKVRKFLQEKLAQANVSRVQIDRPAKSARVTIHTARPGIVIGKKGEDIEKLKQEVAQKMGLK